MGQMMGTAVGTKVFLKYGWRPAAALSVAWSGFTLAVLLVRGPHCERFTWFGYEGGLELRNRDDVVPEVEIKVTARISSDTGVIHLVHKQQDSYPHVSVMA